MGITKIGKRDLAEKGGPAGAPPVGFESFHYGNFRLEIFEDFLKNLLAPESEPEKFLVSKLSISQDPGIPGMEY